MKKLLALLLLASPLYAGTLTLTTTAVQDATVEKERVFSNTTTCTARGLPAACTQVQARTAFCAQVGASGTTPPCTVAGVSSNTVRVYADANDFGESIIRGWTFTIRQTHDARDLEAFAAWRKAATAAQRNAVCVAAGLATGCLPQMSWPDYPPVSMPAGAHIVYDVDPRCDTVGRVIPDLVLCRAMRDAAAEYLTQEVGANRIVPGPKFPAWTFPSSPDWPACVASLVMQHIPEIRLGLSPAWVDGAIGGVPYSGPAAGVAYADYIRVSIADPSRIYRLCAWETSNSLLAYLFDLPNAADGPITAAATDYAATACGVA